jgi:hypothetical protein
LRRARVLPGLSANRHQREEGDHRNQRWLFHVALLL